MASPIPQNQRSREWLEWRRTKIGASEIGTIVGASHFKSIGQLLDEKLGLRKPDDPSDAMIRAIDMEDEARDSFEDQTGHCVYPLVCVHPEYPWLIASLDGITMKKDVAVEIKCPGKKNQFETIKNKKIPDYYIPQLQQAMLVTGLKEIYYYSFDPDSNILLKLSRDEDYLKMLFEKAYRFHQLLMSGFDEIKRHEENMDVMKDQLYRILDDGMLSA